MKAGDKIIAMGYRSQLRRDATLLQLASFYGGFYGYEPFTGYPVFDDPKRVTPDLTPWCFDTCRTVDEAVGMMDDVPRGTLAS